MTIKKAKNKKEAIRLARQHAVAALKEQTLSSHVWCDGDDIYTYQLELYRLAETINELIDVKGSLTTRKEKRNVVGSYSTQTNCY